MEKIRENYGRSEGRTIQEFESENYSPGPTDRKLQPEEEKEKMKVDKIREVRAKNNILWMELLDIALTVVPERGIRILKSILENDKLIMKEMERMVNEYDLCNLDSNQVGIEKVSR